MSPVSASKVASAMRSKPPWPGLALGFARQGPAGAALAALREHRDHVDVIAALCRRLEFGEGVDDRKPVMALLLLPGKHIGVEFIA